MAAITICSDFGAQTGLVVMNSLNFCLYGKLLISPSNQNESLAGRVFLVVGSPLWSLGIYYATAFWLIEFLLRNRLITLWFFPCMLSVFLVAFNNLSLILVSLITCVSVCSSLGLSSLGLSVLPGLIDYFLSHAGEVFSYYLFKYFIKSFLSLFSFWNPCNANIGVFNVVSEVC